jgi:ABC-type uncharacterized transport system involved in gliding motility auxiliary subunit
VPKRIVFLTGHGEKSLHNEEQSGLSRAKVALIKQGYAVESRALLETDPIPENTSVLVITAPTRSIPEGGQQLIQGYVGNGGHLLILADPQSDNSLTQLTRRWGVELGKGIVVDTRDRLGRGSPTALLIRTFTGHDITDEFTIPVFLPVSRYLEFDPVQGTQWEFVSLAQTSSESWAEMDLENKSPELNPEVDVKGPFTIAAALTPKTAMDTTKPQSAIVVVGNSAFATNGYLHYPGNTDFFLQIMAWLAQEDQLVSITPKEPAFRPFVPNPSQEQALLFFQVLFLPFFSLFIGFSIWRKRSRL